MEPGYRFARAVHHSLPSHLHPAFSASVSRSRTLVQSQHMAVKSSRAQIQQDDQQQDTGAAHLAGDSPRLTWSKSCCFPSQLVERDQQADSVSLQSTCQKEISCITPWMCLVFVQSEGNVTAHPSEGLAASLLSLTQVLPWAPWQPGSLISADRKIATHRTGSHQCMLLLFPAGLSPQVSGTSLPREAKTSIREEGDLENDRTQL